MGGRMLAVRALNADSETGGLNYQGANDEVEIEVPKGRALTGPTQLNRCLDGMLRARQSPAMLPSGATW